MEPQAKATVTILLGRLAVHYYRPDFTEAAAKSLIADMLEDLEGFSVFEIEAAIRDHRRDPGQKFFPRSAELRQRAERLRADNRRGANGAIGFRQPEFGEGRPSRWWYMPKRLWRDHWSVNDLNERQRAEYDFWIGRIKAGKIAGRNPDDY